MTDKPDVKKDELPKDELQEELDELAEEDDGSDGTGIEDDESDDGDDKDDKDDKGAKGGKGAKKSTKGAKDDAGEEDDDDRQRDGKGRFVKGGKKDGDAADEEEDDDEGDDADGKKGAGKKGGAAGDDDADDADEEDDGEEEEEPDDKSRASHKIRELVNGRNKMREQIASLTGKIEALEGKGGKAEPEVKPKTAAQLKAEKQGELDELYDKVEELRADNDTKGAAKLQRKIDDIKEEINLARENEIRTSARSEAREELENEKFNAAVDFLEKARPVVDRNHEDYDERVFKELDFQVRAYEKMGLTPLLSLRRACALIFVEDPFAPPAKDTDTGTKDEKDKGGKGKKEPEKKKTDVKKNVDAAKRTPPRGDGNVQDEGDSKDLDIDKLSDEELLALPKSKLDELSGNFDV